MRPGAAQQELLRRLQARQFPKEAFRHAQHVERAWTLLATRPLLAAMQEFRSLLQAFAAHHGADGLYSETLTCFYLLLIRERMDLMPAAHGWAEFQAAHPDLFSPARSFLERWYPDGSAFSEAAKAHFRLPG